MLYKQALQRAGGVRNVVIVPLGLVFTAGGCYPVEDIIAWCSKYLKSFRTLTMETRATIYVEDEQLLLDKLKNEAALVKEIDTLCGAKGDLQIKLKRRKLRIWTWISKAESGYRLLWKSRNGDASELNEVANITSYCFGMNAKI